MRRVRDYVIDPEDPERLDEWREVLIKSRIPEKFWTCTAKAITAPDVRTFVEEAIENAKTWLGRGTGFYLHGGFNSGKTGVMCILGMDACRRGDCVTYLALRDLAGVRFRETKEFELVNDRLYRTDVLLLDDLGSERFRLLSAAGAAMEETVRIVSEKARSVIATSNISWKRFPDHYAEVEAFVSTLKRCVHPFAVINDQWPDTLEKPW